MTELVAIARNPVPSGAVTTLFKGYDGAALRFARWAATRGPRRGTVCCFVGRTEFIEKYFEVIADLRRRGFAVAIMDWRGQGGSFRPCANRLKGHVRDFSEYDRDLACFMRDMVLPDCPPPYIALAHSMGGHILLRNAGMPGSWFERMVITAPMLVFHRSKIPSPRAARLYAEAWTALGFGASYVRGGSDTPLASTVFETNELTGDRDRFSRNRALAEIAPQLQLGDPTIAWLRAACRSMRVLNDPAYATSVKVPVLLFVAGRDTIVEARAVEDFAARLKVGTRVVLANARHEILQETDAIRARFWAAFDAYLGITAEAA